LERIAEQKMLLSLAGANSSTIADLELERSLL